MPDTDRRLCVVPSSDGSAWASTADAHKLLAELTLCTPYAERKQNGLRFAANNPRASTMHQLSYSVCMFLAEIVRDEAS